MMPNIPIFVRKLTAWTATSPASPSHFQTKMVMTIGGMTRWRNSLLTHMLNGELLACHVLAIIKSL